MKRIISTQVINTPNRCCCLICFIFICNVCNYSFTTIIMNKCSISRWILSTHRSCCLLGGGNFNTVCTSICVVVRSFFRNERNFSVSPVNHIWIRKELLVRQCKIPRLIVINVYFLSITLISSYYVQCLLCVLNLI